MSNILIIKHGSLGDIAQASGAIQDISENYKNDKVYLLTTKPYFDLFKKNPFVNDVILDKRLPRYNLIYLYSLMRKLKKHNFSKVFDLQNSSRTNFYRKILAPKSNFNYWSSSITSLPVNKDKPDFDKLSVLERFEHQLKTSGLITKHTLSPNFNWASTDITEIKNFYGLDKYILLFPFCSAHLSVKRWPFFNELIELISKKFGNSYKIITAPGPSEILEAKKINSICILSNGCSLNIPQLTGLIKDSSYIISNDTGPAHISAHVGVKGLALFGQHTSAYKVSIERENFKAIQNKDLNNISPKKILEHLSNDLN